MNQIARIFDGLANIAATRNYLSALAGATTMLIAFGWLSPDQAHALVDACQKFMDGLGQMLGAGKTIVLILGPVIAAVCAKFAGTSATLTARLTSITKDPSVKIEGKIVAPPDVAAAVPSNQVVAKVVVALLIGAGALALLTDPASAQPKLPQLTGDIVADVKAMRASMPDIQAKLDAIKSSLPPVKTPAQVNNDLEQTVSAIEAITVKDFQDGIAVFDAAKNYAGSNCYKALLDVVQANVAANASLAAVDAAQPPTTPADQTQPLPVQHVFLAIAKLYNIVTANQSGGSVNLQCAAMKQGISASGPMSALLGTSAFSKVLPILKIIGIGA